MNRKAQASLEYLMTYGWALVLIATVIGVLVFIASTPESEITFSSSDPTKILSKAVSLSGTDADIVLQNITGGVIKVKQATTDMPNTGCSLNGEAFSSIDSANTAVITAGGEMIIECSGITDPNGRLTIVYNDFAGLERRTNLTVGSGTAPTDLLGGAGSFSSSDGWTLNGPCSITGGRLEYVGTLHGGAIYPSVNAEGGKTYRINFEVIDGTTSFQVVFGGQYFYAGTPGNYSQELTALGVGPLILDFNPLMDPNKYSYVDNIRIYEQ